MCVIQMAALVVVRVLDAPRAYLWMDELRWEVTSPMQAPSLSRPLLPACVKR